jgi:hypothetical protein
MARLAADLVAVAWTLFWGLAGYLIFKAVLALEVISDGISTTGRTFNNLIGAFKGVAGGLPGIGGFLGQQADSLQRFSGDPLIAAGATVHDDIFHLAILLGLLVALPPILIVGLSYGLWRWRDAREMGAAMAFIHASQLTNRSEQARAVLAYRAVATLSFRDLMRASRDPVGDLAEHRYDRLASAMLQKAGLAPYRLPGPDRQKLDAGRGAEKPERHGPAEDLGST